MFARRAGPSRHKGAAMFKGVLVLFFTLHRGVVVTSGRALVNDCFAAVNPSAAFLSHGIETTKTLAAKTNEGGGGLEKKNTLAANKKRNQGAARRAKTHVEHES